MASPYSPPKLDPHKRAALDSGGFDFLMPYDKPLYRTDEVATTIQRSHNSVRELIEAGRLEAHRDSIFGIRKSNLVTRRSVLLYLAETANYDPSSFVDRLESLLKHLNHSALQRLIGAANKRLNAL
jgi:hypothetical protein